jgi:hypothetical protein
VPSIACCTRNARVMLLLSGFVSRVGDVSTPARGLHLVIADILTDALENTGQRFRFRCVAMAARLSNLPRSPIMRLPNQAAES